MEKVAFGNSLNSRLEVEIRDCEISVVVPAFNEEKNIKPLFQRLNKCLCEFGKVFEIIFVNDGSRDGSEIELRDIHREHDNVVVINLVMNAGKAAALEQAFRVVRGEYVVIIDADLQHEPEDIPKLVRKVQEGFDVASGKRIHRMDPKGKMITSRLFNILMRWMTGLKFEDYFSGLKCFRLDVINYLALYGDLYRFASVFAFRNGFKVAEIAVQHHNRVHGGSKYTPWMRLRMAISDLGVVAFSIIFDRKKSYHIGVAGLLLLSIGISLLLLSSYAIESLGTPFGNLYWSAGLILLFVGVQCRLVKKVADEFFVRHQEERIQRAKNVKSILRCRGRSCEKQDVTCGTATL